MMRPPLYFAAACACGLAACGETQSALAPHGPAARDIALLTWLLTGMATVVLATVVAATWIAVRGPDRWRGRIAQTRTIVIGGLAFPVVVLTALLAYGLWLMRVQAAVPSQAPVGIEVVGEQWWWRIRYASADGRTIESANEIRLPVGRDISLTLRSADVIHSIWIPSLAGKMDMIPGRVTTLRLKADRPGIYRGACAEYCGGPHALMALHAVAMSAQEFERRLGVRQAPALDDVQSRGAKLFERAGCGGCHAVDGTQARGSIGPNLTDLGSRPSIGAGLMPMTQNNLIGFIRHGQHLKPGNKMPPFAVFSETQLTDLAAYLAALR
jgi:cytochrome c oxidase subunit II